MSTDQHLCPHGNYPSLCTTCMESFLTPINSGEDELRELMLKFQAEMFDKRNVMNPTTRWGHLTAHQRSVVSTYESEIQALITKKVAEARIDPFDFAESCEPDCTPERHAYHQGQWDMAGRISEYYGYKPYPGAIEFGDQVGQLKKGE